MDSDRGQTATGSKSVVDIGPGIRLCRLLDVSVTVPFHVKRVNHSATHSQNRKGICTLTTHQFSSM
jgi:hypothetical protein